MDSRRISLTSAALTALVAPGSAFNPYAQLHFEQPVSASANDEEMIKWGMKPVDIFGRLHIKHKHNRRIKPCTQVRKSRCSFITMLMARPVRPLATAKPPLVLPIVVAVQRPLF